MYQIEKIQYLLEGLKLQRLKNEYRLESTSSIPETLDHIYKVQGLLLDFIIILLERAILHDESKLYGIEKEFLDNAQYLKDLKYSKTYLQDQQDSKLPAFLDSHYSKNTHHPEHYGSIECQDCGLTYRLYHHPKWEGKCECGSENTKKIINLKGMDLADLVEMFFDWVAATKRHEDGSIYRSIKINKERFNYDETLEAIFRNSVKEGF